MFLSLLAGLLLAPAADTLQAVTVVADRGVVVSRADTVIIQPLSDAGSILTGIPALYVGDYGSASGLKSASLRGLGSAHTAIYVDGVRVGNVQSGQADLGFLDFNDLSAVVVDYAQNSLSFSTAQPFFDGKKVVGGARLGYGSFGTWQPYAKLAFRLGKNWSLSTHAGGIVTNGQFPLEDGSVRANNDLKQLQAGADLWGRIDDGDFHAKVCFNGAARGTPGSTAWPSTDRQTDRNVLGQWCLRKAVSPLYTLHLSGKTAYDKIYYASEWGDSTYEQTEFQLNSVHKFTLAPWWTVSLAADASLDGLLSNLYRQDRIGAVAAVATAFRLARFKADIALEYAGTFDEGHSPWHSLSPSLDLRLTLAPGLDLVAFGRRAFRAPTFNELYYPGYGNTELRPEDAWLADAGLDWHCGCGAWTLKARADGFYNWLTDKIVSAPMPADPNIWLPYNVGKVQAVGADVLAAADYDSGDWKAAFSARYSYQNAVDKTPESYTLGQPVPYIAKHTVALSGEASWKGWGLGAAWNLRAGRRDAAGEMPDWNTLDAQAGKTFRLGRLGQVGLKVIGRNLLNCRYETVSGYPMPGRSLMAAIEYGF